MTTPLNRADTAWDAITDKVADDIPTVVIFRKYRDTGAIVAIFPEIPGSPNPSTCLTYEHIGQHGSGFDSQIVSITEPAKASEYADLRRELESIGYVLDIKRKNHYRFYRTRRDALIMASR